MKLFIGIDPGEHTGWAVWDATRERFTEVETITFWRAYRYACDLQEHRDRVVFVVENPSQRVTYARPGQNERQMRRISRGVGMNQMHARLLIEGLRDLGFEVREVVPTGAKWDRPTFDRYTGWRGRTSEHARDAGRLVFGLTR